MSRTTRRRGQPKMGAPFAKIGSRKNRSPKTKDTRRELSSADDRTKQIPVGDRSDDPGEDEAIMRFANSPNN